MHATTQKVYLEKPAYFVFVQTSQRLFANNICTQSGTN